MRDPWDDSELARRFRETTATLHPRAPLYAELSKGIARDPELYGLLHHAPATQQLPVLLFACTHALLLEDPDHELAAWYPNVTASPRSPTDPLLIGTFKSFVTERSPELMALLSTRSTQTNEVGRCLMLMPAMGLVAAEVGPVAHLDVGASGGLNLLLDRYAYRYVADDDGSDHEVGPASPVELTASTRGTGPIPSELPEVTARCGVDATPIDVTDDAEARWLEACVWPDQRDRFLRLRAAIGLARHDPPELLAGDAVDSLAPAIERMARSGHPVVTNSWVLNYLPPGRRVDYVAELDRIGAEVDLSWIAVESPTMTPELPWDTGNVRFDLTSVLLTRWRDGMRSSHALATTHPHGFWIHWAG